MKDTPEFADEMFWIFSGAELVILSLASIGCVGGFIQVKYMKIYIHIFLQMFCFFQILEKLGLSLFRKLSTPKMFSCRSKT
jgi:hypothetical protein